MNFLGKTVSNLIPRAILKRIKKVIYRRIKKRSVNVLIVLMQERENCLFSEEDEGFVREEIYGI